MGAVCSSVARGPSRAAVCRAGQAVHQQHTRRQPVLSPTPLPLPATWSQQFRSAISIMAAAPQGPSLGQHASFFNSLVELIPARFYHGGEELLHLTGMKKAERAAAKQDLKEKAKDNKRAKLDPDVPNTSLAVQQQHQQERVAQQQGGASDAHASEAGAVQLVPADSSRESLQAKLQAKIQVGVWELHALQQACHAASLRKPYPVTFSYPCPACLQSVQQQRNKKKEKQAVAQQAGEWREKTLENNVKQKQKQAQQALTVTKRCERAIYCVRLNFVLMSLFGHQQHGSLDGTDHIRHLMSISLCLRFSVLCLLPLSLFWIHCLGQQSQQHHVQQGASGPMCVFCLGRKTYSACC